MSPLISSSPRTDRVLVGLLIAMTAVTGVVDAVSFLSLGRIFTANMTGNVVLLAFATARVPGLSVRRSGTALVLFLAGAILGGRIMSRASADSQIRVATRAFALETAFLLASTVCAIGYRGDLLEDSFQSFALIAFTALAMGTRNAAVRKLAIPDLTTTVLTLTITGLGADSSLADGSNLRWQRRVASLLAMFAGAALGAIVVRHTVLAALALAAGFSAVSSAALLSFILWNQPAQAPIRGN